MVSLSSSFIRRSLSLTHFDLLVFTAYPQIFDSDSITDEIKFAAYAVLNSENQSSASDDYKYVFDLEVSVNRK